MRAHYFFEVNMVTILSQLKTIDQVLLILYLQQKQQQNLKPDVSSYAKGRLRSWLRAEWDLREKRFRRTNEDEWLWNYLSNFLPEDFRPDLGLIIYGETGIQLHRDAMYADYRAITINLGAGIFVYDGQYPEFRWTQRKNPSRQTTHTWEGGEVVEFNCKNPHAMVNPDPSRWAIVLWQVKGDKVRQFEEQTGYKVSRIRG